MGILVEPMQFIRALPLRKGFSVIELGDQFITAGGAAQRAPASQFYRDLGCGRYEAIDGNGRGTVTADLNRPLVKQAIWLSGFDLVTDFGTGEHVFDQRQVWQTMHDLVRVGGFIAFDRPCAGYEGHCFYLIQPCVIAGLAHANGYEVMFFQRTQTTRGELLRGVFRKARERKFAVPQQGRYFKDLSPILSRDEQRRGPDHKSGALRGKGVVGPGSTSPTGVES